MKVKHEEPCNSTCSWGRAQTICSDIKLLNCFWDHPMTQCRLIPNRQTHVFEPMRVDWHLQVGTHPLEMPLSWSPNPCNDSADPLRNATEDGQQSNIQNLLNTVSLTNSFQEYAPWPEEAKQWIPKIKLCVCSRVLGSDQVFNVTTGVKKINPFRNLVCLATLLHEPSIILIIRYARYVQIRRACASLVDSNGSLVSYFSHLCSH